MTNNQLTSTHLAVKSKLDGYKIHASRGQATAMAMVRLFESIDRDLEELQERRKADSEPVELPLDYLQGHKDGLEWAAQLAEANHPETGDWLYDDPIELAKAIRKGPDMPPAQPAPVVDADDNFYSWFGREWAENYQHNQYTTAAKQMLGVMAESAWKAGLRAAMLQAEPVCTCPSGNDSLRWPCPVHPGNYPAIGVDLASGQDRTVEVRYVAPPGYVMVPMRLTAENGAKGALSGEFSETKFVNCPECFGDDECETCDGSGRIEITVPVTWTTIKEIWAKGVEHFTTAPQSPGSEPATAPGKWIPVSEQMPPSRHEVLVGCWWGEKPRWCCKWATYIPGHPDAQSSGWLIPGASWTPTHWMPLPAAPQEVKGE